MRTPALLAVIAALSIANPTPAIAQQQETKATASNGVVVSVNGDEFANRYEYSAPSNNIEGGGFSIVAAIKKATGTTPVMVMGSIYYTGDWLFYDQALFRGGEQVPAIFGDREVVSCSGSRYGGCSHREGFQLTPTTAQLKKYAEGGVISMQLRAKGLFPIMVSVPISHFDAIKEVAGIRTGEATDIAPPATPNSKPATPPPATRRLAPKVPAKVEPAVSCVTCRSVPR